MGKWHCSQKEVDTADSAISGWSQYKMYSGRFSFANRKFQRTLHTETDMKNGDGFRKHGFRYLELLYLQIEWVKFKNYLRTGD